MTDEEVNKIIAEYMGSNIIGEHECKDCGNILLSDLNYRDGSIWGMIRYTESLDALVPVWEKLRDSFDIYYEHRYREFDLGLGRSTSSSIGNTIQQAAAHATAKAIQELNDTDDNSNP
jgi:hypothetical protein